MVSPINWVITGFDARSLGTYMELLIKTDVMVYLECFWTYDDPDVQLIPRYQRGVRTWCLVKKRIPDWHRAFQSEWADSIYHTFRLPIDFIWRKHYLRFEGTFLGTPTISNSPIFQRTIRIFWEDWDKGLTGTHPWTKHEFNHIVFNQEASWIHYATDNPIWGPVYATIYLGSYPYLAPIIEHIPHYLLTHVRPGWDRATNWAYLSIVFRITARTTYSIRFYWAYTGTMTWPYWPPYGYQNYYGMGKHQIDLWDIITQMSAHYHTSRINKDCPITAFVQEARIPNAPSGYHPFFRQDYIDFLEELPD